MVVVNAGFVLVGACLAVRSRRSNRRLLESVSYREAGRGGLNAGDVVAQDTGLVKLARSHQAEWLRVRIPIPTWRGGSGRSGVNMVRLYGTWNRHILGRKNSKSQPRNTQNKMLDRREWNVKGACVLVVPCQIAEC